MEEVTEVCELCRELNSEKSTERKKAIEKLRNCLSRANVKKVLDHNFTEGKSSSKNFTWENVFRATRVFICMESNDLKAANSKVSKSTLTLRETRKQEASALVKFVVRQAHIGGPKLKGSLLFDHIIEVMKDEFMCEAYGQDYCSILLKNVLSTRKYIMELSGQSWHDLLQLFFKLFNNPDIKTVDKLVLARIIRSVISGLTSQTDVRPKKILAFFSDFFCRGKELRSPGLIEHMLVALNTVIRTIAPQSRVQVCKLGEDIMQFILYLWKNVASEPLKDSLIEFIQTQVWAHHPQGAKKGSVGAYAVDWDTWTSCLKKVYEVFYTEMQYTASKTKVKDCALKSTFVDLAVDICNQLFSDDSHSIDVTQTSLLDTQAGPSTKKRRLESGWEAIRGIITAAGQTPRYIPWIQLVTRLVDKYTRSLPSEEVLPYMTCLAHMLSNCKRTELTVYILRCLYSFAYNWYFLVTIATDINRQTKAIWSQVWSTSLRFVSLHKGEADGYNLLSCMVEKGLILPGQEIWSMFVPSVSLPSPNAVKLLATCVKHCDLPEKYVPKAVVTLQPIGGDTKFPLRKQLIDWLLPSREEDSDLPRVEYKIDADWTAHILMALTLRDPSAFVKDCSVESEALSGLEKAYLETSLQKVISMGDCNKQSSGRSSQDVVHISVLLKVLDDTIHRDVQYYKGRSEIQVSDVEEMVTYTEMVLRILGLLLQLGIFTSDTLHTIGFSRHLSALMVKLTSAVVDMAKKEGHKKVQRVLVGLQQLYSVEGDSGRVLATVCRGVTPAKLIELLWDIINDKTLNRVQSDSSATQSRFNRSVSHGRRTRILDDFDDDFDMEIGDQSNNNNHDDFAAGDGMDSQEKEESGSVESCSSLLSPGSLPENQTLKLEAIRLLCLWCCHGNQNGPIRCEVDVKYTRSKVIALLKDATFDPTKPVDIQQLRIIVNHFTDKEQLLGGTDLNLVTEAIRRVAKYHRKDQEVCSLCLNMLSNLVPSLAHTDTVDLEESRESAIHLVQAFCQLQNEGEGHSAAVRLSLLQILEQLIKYDPDSIWSMLPSLNTEDSDSSETVPPSRFFLDYGADLSHTVRMHVASTLYRLFVRQDLATKLCVDQKSQEDYLSQLYDILKEALDIQGKLSAERLEDEKCCRTASVLSSLATVICVSPVCEKKAVFMMIKISNEFSVDQKMTQTVLSSVAEKLKFSSLANYMESHLPFLLHHWLLAGFSIGEFPYRLLSCDQNKQFYRQYKSVIIPALVVSRNIDGVQTVASELGVARGDLLRDCVPRTVVYILPLFAASGLQEAQDSEAVRKRTKKATLCYEFLKSELSEKDVDGEIQGNLEAVVVNILMCLYDPDLDDGDIGNSNPEPNPPSYNTYIITSTLDYITKSFQTSGKTLIEILSKTPDSIQRILLELATSLFTSHRLSERRRVLLAYQLFVRLLLKQFSTKLGGSWVYVLREVIFRLVYLIKDVTTVKPSNSIDASYSQAIASMSVQLLREVCTVGIEICPQELMKYLPLLTSHLVSLVQHEGEVKDQSLALLKLLVLEKAKILRSAIASLDNFPDTPTFKDFSAMHRKLKYAKGAFTLSQEVDHFLAITDEHHLDPELRLEGLKYLHQELVTNREQIGSLAQDGSQPRLCRLVQELVRLCGCGSEGVRLRACQCLGVVGPVNLNTISIPDTHIQPGLQEALTQLEELPDGQKYCRIFHLLNEYLLDKNMELVQCTSGVLKALLSMKTGAEFAAQYRAHMADTELLFHYLHPFRAAKKKAPKLAAPSVNWDNFVATVDREQLWNPPHGNHGDWVITLATTLINSGAVSDEVLRLLEPVCKMKRELCEAVLPYLVHNILQCGDDGHRELLSRQLNNFFSCHCGQSGGGSGTRANRTQSVCSVVSYDEDYICMNVSSVRVILSVVQYLRQQPRVQQGRTAVTPWDNNFWLDLDYLQVAMAAQHCSAHFSTLLYAEIWCDVQRDKTDRNSQSQRRLSQDTRIDTLSEASSVESGVNVQDLLLEAYRWIGDPDGVYGCGAGRKADTASRICTYEHENQWDKAVISCDINMDQSVASSQYSVLHSLQNFGASHIFETYLHGAVSREDMSGLTSDMKELQFEASWKMAQWNIDTPNKLHENVGFHECLYKGLKALVEEDLSFTQAALDKARLCSVSGVREGCLDTVGRLYPILADLQCVSVLEQAAQHLTRQGQANLSTFIEFAAEAENDFVYLAPSLYMGCTATKTLWHKTKDETVLQGHVNSLLRLARCAREAVRHQISERAVHQLKCLTLPDSVLTLECQIEEARLYWSRGEFNIAKHLLRSMIEQLKKVKHEDQSAVEYYPRMLSIYGNWLAETRSENPNVIMEDYLEKTVLLFEKSGSMTDTCVDAYLSLARYADTQYQNIVNYMKSSTFEAKNSLMNKSRTEAERLRKLMGAGSKDLYLRTLEKQGRIDAQELQSKLTDRERFLLRAVEGYIKCLKLGDAHNLRVFRLASLWFNNASNEEVNTFMQEAVEEISCYKWLPLMYQLAARMDTRPHGDTTEPFLNTLNQLIYETAVTHPYHTLSCVLTLANANRDRELQEQAKASRRSGKGRIEAAKQMVERLREDGKVGGIVREMQAMCDAYIQLANWDVSKHKTETKPIQLPSALWIAQIKELKHVPVLTRDIKVNPSGSYDNIPYIAKFNPTFKLAGGINLPKIISCLGSDGVTSRQLVKGRDDLRQDAVMQQVFEMVNNLLMKDNEARKRKLHIRTYKVIPLSQRSGLLEWCEGTQPIGEYLIGSSNSTVKGAHQRYRPKDWLFYQCRTHLKDAAGNNEDLYKAYGTICKNFQPVFRHFFLEKFAQPSVWFERRLAYTRSVATNSIVGYILGLGDRHVQNILIDCNTAELVHIDLGVAFEQGRILTVPETVPFRLTRDIEDAMGSCGVEGVFRRCCERTMEVMRTNQEAVLTILEVLLHDPLHVWTISPLKAYELQQRRDRGNDTMDLTSDGDSDIEDSVGSRSHGDSQENVNKLAERVLLRLQQKLQGLEDGVQLSLTGQVNHLIQDARNPKNLARLFPGWQPYI